MATFQSIVVIVAICVLIVSLVFIGFALRKQKNSASYPPVIANCPDYWIDASGNNGAACTMDPKVGISGNAKCTSPMNFSSPMWQGQSGLCGKYKWATQCNLSWDGITNNASICGS
jgi:hypothetical protein